MARRFEVILEDGYGTMRPNLHAAIRAFFRERGERVIRTTSSSVCGTCYGDGTVDDGPMFGNSRCIRGAKPCPDCNGNGKRVPA